jgi:hypothetical protein
MNSKGNKQCAISPVTLCSTGQRTRVWKRSDDRGGLDRSVNDFITHTSHFIHFSPPSQHSIREQGVRAQGPEKHSRPSSNASRSLSLILFDPSFSSPAGASKSTRLLVGAIPKPFVALGPLLRASQVSHCQFLSLKGDIFRERKIVPKWM